jgi:hypothetical protein
MEGHCQPALVAHWEGQMKSAIYLDEGNTQLVLTPENDWERNILHMMHGELKDKSYWGQFYECQGGWIRQYEAHYSASRPLQDDSLILRVKKDMPDIPSEPAT